MNKNYISTIKVIFYHKLRWRGEVNLMLKSTFSFLKSNKSLNALILSVFLSLSATLILSIDHNKSGIITIEQYKLMKGIFMFSIFTSITYIGLIVEEVISRYRGALNELSQENEYLKELLLEKSKNSIR